MSDTLTVTLPDAFRELLIPARYKTYYGGRGSAKSWSFAIAIILLMLRLPLRVLCTREYQNSIADSVYRLLVDTIARLKLEAAFNITRDSISSKLGGMILFKGLHHNVQEIKSTEGIDICWVEEAELVSDYSWDVLIPTIRNKGSEIWTSFNTRDETDPTYKRMVLNPPPGAVVRKVSWRDNPWFSPELRAEKDYAARVDPDAYQWIWEGMPRQVSDAQILRGKYKIEPFEPMQDVWSGPYYGADFGFSIDPSTLIKLWVWQRKIYIEAEVYGVGIEINDLPARFADIADAKKHTIRADNARPETISYLRNHGYPNIVGVDKWTGSVEDGIAHLRSYEEIVIHPRCKHTAEEARLWSYKVDRLSGDVLPVVKDGHDHCWDAVRYGLQPLIRRPSSVHVEVIGNHGALASLEDSHAYLT